jgi:hypothetical protein
MAPKNQEAFEPLVSGAALSPTGERRIYWPPFPVSIDLRSFFGSDGTF